MYRPSFWEQEQYFSNIDICIIGSGITGLCAAISIKQKAPDKNVLVAERGFIPYGASTRNAGFACFGSITELMADLSAETESEVFERVKMRYNGLQNLRKLIGDHEMHYEHHGGYELFLNGDEQVYENVQSKIEYFNTNLSGITGEKHTYSVVNADIEKTGFKKTIGLIRNSCEGQIDTGKLMHALTNLANSLGVKILTGIEVDGISDLDNKTEIICSNGFAFHARKAAVATNGFANKLLNGEDIKPARAQVMLTKPIDKLPFTGTFHFDEGYYYFRNVGKRVLFGGGRNLDFKSEETSEFGESSIIRQKLQELLSEVILPGLRPETEMRWSGIMGLGSSRSPVIKRTGKNVYCAVRLGGMGIAIGHSVGSALADLMLES